MYIIDRFKGDWAIIESDRKTFKLPRDLVPQEAVEGDVVVINVNIDARATARLAGEVKELADTLYVERRGALT